jgi:hypothetical protein
MNKEELNKWIKESELIFENEGYEDQASELRHYTRVYKHSDKYYAIGFTYSCLHNTDNPDEDYGDRGWIRGSYTPREVTKKEYFVRMPVIEYSADDGYPLYDEGEWEIV